MRNVSQSCYQYPNQKSRNFIARPSEQQNGHNSFVSQWCSLYKKINCVKWLLNHVFQISGWIFNTGVRFTWETKLKGIRRFFQLLDFGGFVCRKNCTFSSQLKTILIYRERGIHTKTISSKMSKPPKLVRKVRKFSPLARHLIVCFGVLILPWTECKQSVHYKFRPKKVLWTISLTRVRLPFVFCPWGDLSPPPRPLKKEISKIPFLILLLIKTYV